MGTLESLVAELSAHMPLASVHLCQNTGHVLSVFVRGSTGRLNVTPLCLLIKIAFAVIIVITIYAT